MTDWKMPILMIPGPLAVRLEDFLRAEGYPAGKNSASHIDWLLKELRNLNLLSTPAERDEGEKLYGKYNTMIFERDKKIKKLETKVERLGGELDEIKRRERRKGAYW